MATLTKVYGDLEAQGFTKAEIDAVEDNSVKRDYLLPNNVYGGNNATVKGTWKADKVGIIVNKNNEIKRKIVWAVCFVPDGAKESVCDLTKSFLLSTGRYDADNNHVAPKGDIRQWADLNIINGKLDKEWCGELSTLLNTRGLVVVNEEFPCTNTKTGGRFVAFLQQPYFADTFGK